MAKNVYNKSIIRTIFGSMGRYIAILAIIALGVGFFAGVKNTKASMMETCEKYVNDYNLYNFRLVSTFGFNEDDEKYLNEVEGVKYAEGSITTDFFSKDNDGNSIVLRAHSITDNINLIDLQNGRLPEKGNECVVDDYFYSENDIGNIIKVTDENDDDTVESLEHREYIITGIMKSPNYITKEDRGTTSLGDGNIDAYIYVPKKGLTSEYYTEMLIYCEEQGYIFSEEYNGNMDDIEPVITAAGEKRGNIRYNDIIKEAEEELEKGKAELEDGKYTLQKEKREAYAQLEDAKKELDENKEKLSDGKEQLAEQKELLEEKKEEIVAAIGQVEEALAGLMLMPEPPAETIAELEMQLAQLQGALDQINEGFVTIREQKNELLDSQRQLNDGYDQYYVNKRKVEKEFAEAEAEIAEAEAEIRDAEKEIAEIEKPELYVQVREDNIGFGSFESNSDIVDSIAKVFPVFFFLIAALVCSTTMTRMIEEERSQIGALRALGFSNRRIMRKYMIYSGSAAIIGCVIGFVLGSRLFPYAIWIAYGMMFGFAPLEHYFDWKLAVISLVVAFICSAGTTYFACRGQLKSVPAEILRPKTPKAGKRILLERVHFIWSNLKFLYKVSLRNVFRYKKRMFMMILGIAGCTALVIAGLGIDDSVAGISDHQYGSIEKYDTTVVFEDKITENKKNDFEKEFEEELESIALLQQTSVKIKGPDAVKTCNIMIPEDDSITRVVNFNLEDGKVNMPEPGEAVLSNGVAENIGVKKGERITVIYDDTEEVVLEVSDIYRNYVGNYIYIDKETFVKDFKKEYEPSIMYVTVKDEEQVRKVSEDINGFDGVVGVFLNVDQRAGIDKMMLSLNYIIILVIVCAGALAFIVLFNLSNINITEREREIATIKVLGFYPNETGAYVFRENFILVLMGIVAGLPTGYILHKFIMERIIVDAVSFNEVIEPISYLYAVAIVICFDLIVDVIMRRKLKKINMAEALKSIE